MGDVTIREDVKELKLGFVIFIPSLYYSCSHLPKFR